jgi:hypothetical protein
MKERKNVEMDEMNPIGVDKIVADRLVPRTVNANTVTVLGSIPASSDTVESAGSVEKVSGYKNKPDWLVDISVVYPDLEPDPDWILIQWSPWIRIRNLDPDSGWQK